MKETIEEQIKREAKEKKLRQFTHRLNESDMYELAEYYKDKKNLDSSKVLRKLIADHLKEIRQWKK